MSNYWDDCNHKWEWPGGDTDDECEVRCKICGVPGQLNAIPSLEEMMGPINEDADVFWPAT